MAISFGTFELLNLFQLLPSTNMDKILKQCKPNYTHTYTHKHAIIQYDRFSIFKMIKNSYMHILYLQSAILHLMQKFHRVSFIITFL